MDLDGSCPYPDPSTGFTLPPLIVTASSPSQTRRWQVLLASTGMRVARPAEVLSGDELPALHAHIESHDAWLTWVRPAEGIAALEVALKRWWWSADAQLSASLAGTRATAAILACLPVLGVLLGQLIGARPVRFLFSGGPGGVLLLIGVTLISAGLIWADRIIDRLVP